jgi:hypothetical protein
MIWSSADYEDLTFIPCWSMGDLSQNDFVACGPLQKHEIMLCTSAGTSISSLLASNLANDLVFFYVYTMDIS